MNVFISYRRRDCQAEATTIYLTLSQLQNTSVFFDVESIAPGEDFAAAIEREVRAADVVLVLIGNDWLNLPAPDGTRRIDNPSDHVHREVALSLELARSEDRPSVIPVLVEGVEMPPETLLPEPLRGLTLLNALHVRPSSLLADARTLTSTVAGIHAADARPAPSPRPTPAGVIVEADPVGGRMAEVAALLAAEDAAIAADGRYVKEADLTGALAEILPGAQTERTLEIPNWDPQPGRFDLVVEPDRQPVPIAIECKLKDSNDTYESLWDALKLMALKHGGAADEVYVVAATTKRWWSKARGAALFSSGELAFLDMLEELGGWWEKYLLPESTGRPLRFPKTFECEQVAAVPLRIRGGEWEIRAVKLEPAEEWLPMVDGIPLQAGGKLPQAEPPASRRVFPKRITERWLEDNVPSMTRTEFIALAAEMRSRGWSDGWIIDYALSFHPESEGIRARCPIGEGDNARGFEMPQRATTRWAERIAPGLTADELAFVTAELLERGWSPGDIDDYLYVYAKPEYLTQQGFG